VVELGFAFVVGDKTVKRTLFQKGHLSSLFHRFVFRQQILKVSVGVEVFWMHTLLI